MADGTGFSLPEDDSMPADDFVLPSDACGEPVSPDSESAIDFAAEPSSGWCLPEEVDDDADGESTGDADEGFWGFH